MILHVLMAASLAIAAETLQIENRTLSWADFRGRVDGESPYDAFTYWSVHYSYDVPTPEGAGFRVSVRVWNQLDERSWVKPKVAKDPHNRALLDHEQGHYALGVLCALEFKRTVSRHLFSRRYHAEIRDLFDEVLKKYLEMEKTYDAETRHMRDPSAQQLWDRRLAQMITERWGDR